MRGGRRPRSPSVYVITLQSRCRDAFGPRGRAAADLGRSVGMDRRANRFASVWDIGDGTRARELWHVTANEASPSVTDHGRLDTRQDTPPDAFRV